MSRTMKDSGIEWIGDVPEEWEVHPFKAYYKTTKGLNITKENLVERGIPVISYGQIHSKLNTGTSICDALIRYVPETYLESNPECLSKKYDIFFADTSEDVEGAGNIAFVDTDTPIFAGYHTIIARPQKEVKTKYFAYLAKTDAWRTQIRNSLSGVKVFSISQKLINRVYIILPPLAEQHLIATFLDKKCSEIDSLIDLQEQMIEELKAYKQSVITEAVTKGIRNEEFGIRNEELGIRNYKDSGIEWIGDVPEEWEVCKVSRLFYVQLGKMLQPNRENETYELCNYLCAANVGKNVLKLEPLKQMWISEREKEQYSVKKGDLLVVEGGDVASCDIINEDVSDLYIQNALHRVRSKGEQDVRVLRYLLIVAKCRGYIDLICNKATISHFTKEKFESMPYIVSPTPKEQQAIADYLDKKCGEIDELITIKQQKIESLKEYKKSVIYEYVTGKKEP